METGYPVVDKRPGAGGPIPPWLLEEENAQSGKQAKGESFDQGIQALIRSDYTEAARRFEQAIGIDSWAVFWLGKAYYELGEYDLAVEYFGTMLKLFGGDKKPVPFCNYARGLAYAITGDLDAATADFQACLPAMIQTLRLPSAGYMFEYADNPLIRIGRHEPSDRETIVKMTNRLRLVTGQDFGYDPDGTFEQNEAAIAAWEQWFRDDGRIQFTPDAELLPVPAPTQQNH